MPSKQPEKGLGQQLNELHAASVAGDPTAPAQIFRRSYEPLCAFLRKLGRSHQEEDVYDAASDALLFYMQKPERYDPGKASLWTFLCSVARNKYLNAQRTTIRRQVREKKGSEQFAVLAPAANNIWQSEDFVLAQQIEARFVPDIAKTDAEKKVFELICSGVRETSEYAVALGIEPSAPDALEAVKKVKDKIKARMRHVRSSL